MNQKYDEALEQYKKYVQLNPTDIRGEIGVKSCNYSIEWLSNPTRYKVELMPIVNSRYSDFSLIWKWRFFEIYFTSSKRRFSDKLMTERRIVTISVSFSRVNGVHKSSENLLVEMGMRISCIVAEEQRCVNQVQVEKKKSLGCRIYISKEMANFENPQLQKSLIVIHQSDIRQ